MWIRRACRRHRPPSLTWRLVGFTRAHAALLTSSACGLRLTVRKCRAEKTAKTTAHLIAPGFIATVEV
ncbi:hypothetical protein Pmani_004073 [Petrolisthes manimaculis]|uniref:Uncharacterized protein n=1 Tax=Petrolisthes manimaculis TaxID=1843537 RepID=A0AAE1QEF2_9EUCA|nr:hypothetical protein Pmani_004073 [Petrolisthes manimaculis]